MRCYQHMAKVWTVQQLAEPVSNVTRVASENAPTEVPLALPSTSGTVSYWEGARAVTAAF